MTSEQGHTVPQAVSGARLGWHAPRIALVGGAYFVIAILALKLASINPSATPIWPPTGLALAAVILWGYRVSPAVYVAALLANVAVTGSIHTSALIACGNTLECLVGAYLVNRWSGGAATFDTPTGVARFALICLLVATPISATVGVGTLLATGYAEMDESLPIWATWWLGDLAGAVVVAPVLILWSRAGLFSSAPRELRASAITVAAASLVGIIAFSPLIAEGSTRNALGFLAVVPLSWAALRGRRADTATAALILAAFAVWGAMAQVGPFARNTQNDSFLLLLMFMMSVSVPSLILSADVSVRREAEQLRKLLSAELDHRVKNTLAKAQAIAALTLRTSQSPQAFNEAFVARLQAMARNHEVLARTGWRDVSLETVVTDTLAPYADAGDRVLASGPPVTLKADVATTLGMALHELVTNAAKYGALSTSTGRVSLNWRTDGDFLDLRWMESNGPPVQARTRSGFGMTFIEYSLATSLGGRVDVDFAPQGLVCTIRFPLS
ncbi:MASE1 domain-containing protein [Dongia deserti]|uniref:MASE1 domain-containing protein n=1 Tax=Dongia deserti TaxID=2268030 RepID=UPI000E65C460|nr:MASE1 domain-containing protein [Dongia deserti]